jgi:hypothetical protein
MSDDNNSENQDPMLKIDMTSFAGSMVATIVMKTMKVNKIVKANDARSPDVTGMQNRMSDDSNSENQDLRESFETQTISKLSMEFLDSVCFYIFFFVFLQLITYFAIIIYS